MTSNLIGLEALLSFIEVKNTITPLQNYNYPIHNNNKEVEEIS